MRLHPAALEQARPSPDAVDGGAVRPAAHRCDPRARQRGRRLPRASVYRARATDSGRLTGVDVAAGYNPSGWTAQLWPRAATCRGGESQGQGNGE